MVNSKQLSETAVQLYEMLAAHDCFEKQDVVAILNVLVELDVRRRLRGSAAHAAAQKGIPQ